MGDGFACRVTRHRHCLCNKHLLSIGAFIAGLFSSIMMGAIKHHSRVKEDAIMGIVFSGMFALGILLITKIETDVHLLHVLFGNILGITQFDLIEMAVISSICFIIMIIKRKEFMSCFDPAQANGIGLSKSTTDCIDVLIIIDDCIGN